MGFAHGVSPFKKIIADPVYVTEQQALCQPSRLLQAADRRRIPAEGFEFPRDGGTPVPNAGSLPPNLWAISRFHPLPIADRHPFCRVKTPVAQLSRIQSEKSADILISKKACSSVQQSLLPTQTTR
jgi:hypothetical protein